MNSVELKPVFKPEPGEVEMACTLQGGYAR